MTSPVSAIEAIERFERAVRANGYRTGDDQTEAEYQAAKAAVIALARQAEALQRRAEEAEALAERLKLEAQSHAQEARTANSTIYEIYQVVSGGKGEPGNWHGAKPVRAKLEALQRENAELAKSFLEVLNAVRDYLPPDGISVKDCLSRVIGAVDNSDINPLIEKLERADVDA